MENLFVLAFVPGGWGVASQVSAFSYIEALFGLVPLWWFGALVFGGVIWEFVPKKYCSDDSTGAFVFVPLIFSVVMGVILGVTDKVFNLSDSYSLYILLGGLAINTMAACSVLFNFGR